MADADWQRVWMIPTVDTDGKPIKLFVGQVQHKGKTETAIRVDAGPTALIPVEEVVGKLLKAIRETSEATWIRNEQAQS